MSKIELMPGRAEHGRRGALNLGGYKLSALINTKIREAVRKFAYGDVDVFK